MTVRRTFELDLFSQCFRVILPLVALSVVPIFGQTIESKTIFGQVYTSSECIINARLDSVIIRLVHTSEMASIMDCEYRSGAKWLLKVGDAASIVPIQGKFGQRDSGVVILSQYRPPMEVWFTFDPQNGKYICQDRWTFTRMGMQCKVVFMERIMDSDGSISSELTGQRQRMIQDRLAKLKALSERR